MQVFTWDHAPSSKAWTLKTRHVSLFSSLQYPHMIEVIDIGQTFERRPILLAKISLKNNLPGITKRAIFIEAGKTITTSKQV